MQDTTDTLSEEDLIKDFELIRLLNYEKSKCIIWIEENILFTIGASFLTWIGYYFSEYYFASVFWAIQFCFIIVAAAFIKVEFNKLRFYEKLRFDLKINIIKRSIELEKTTLEKFQDLFNEDIPVSELSKKKLEEIYIKTHEPISTIRKQRTEYTSIVENLSKLNALYAELLSSLKKDDDIKNINE